jgi:CRISPR-associated endoribonuclease Cas6
MPHLVTLPLQWEDKAPPPELHRALHANLYAWFAAADLDLADGLHRQSVRKPFTLSPLIRRGKNGPALRMALLEDELWKPLHAGLCARPFADLLGRSVPLALESLEVHHRSYAEFLDHASTDTRIALRFLTPTCFKAGDLDSPLPAPHSMIRSWLSRWSQYAPPPLRINVALVDAAWAHVAISGYDLSTKVRDLGYGKQMGFVGRLSLRVVKAGKLGEEILRQLNALADYAEFCGTGRKTTHGMGQTRRIR